MGASKGRPRAHRAMIAPRNPGRPAWHVGRSYRVAHHIEMPAVADYVTMGEYIPPSDGVAGLEAELGQWNDGIKTEVRAQSPGEWAKA